MTTRAARPERVTIEVWQREGQVTCDYWVYPSNPAGAVVKAVLHRRVLVTLDEPLNRAGLTILAQRMATYVVGTQTTHQTVTRGAPWWEVGRTEMPVPPEGGKGGEEVQSAMSISRTGDVQVVEEALPSSLPPAAVKGRRAKRVPVEVP